MGVQITELKLSRNLLITCFQNWKVMCGEFNGFFIYYSVVKHLGSSQSTQEEDGNTRVRLVFPVHFVWALAASCCFTTKQSTIKVSLFVNQPDATTIYKMVLHKGILLKPNEYRWYIAQNFLIGSAPAGYEEKAG